MSGTALAQDVLPFPDLPSGSRAARCGQPTANDSVDIGHDSYSPLSPAYFDRAPFDFDGTIKRLVVKQLPQK
jgi:hypothetical protein